YTSRHREAEKFSRDAVELFDELKVEQPARSRSRELLATALLHLAGALEHRQQFTDAAGCLRRAADVRSRLAGDFPSVPAFRSQVAEAQQAVARLAQQQHNRTEAVRAFEKALEMRRTL